MREGEPPDQPVEPQAQAGEPQAPVAAYRCFLFADLRGYTSFMERAGNAAGVELLGDYARIVRAEVARHHGAEIKVEGDGFHIVFPSASSAVMCGLAIVDAAAQANATNPDRPIDIGIGIHAGEALETPDGYIGAAVNIAARVCALAQAGEVLVTGTVRGIAAASVPVGFVARGRERLKGIGEPVELFAVTRDPTVSRRAGRALGRSHLWWAAAGLAAVALVGAIGVAALLGSNPAVTPTPSAASKEMPPTRPLVLGPMTIGSYATDQFQPPFSFVITDTDWTLYRNASNAVGLFHEIEPKGRLDIGRIDRLYTDACIPDGPTTPAGSSALDLVSELQSSVFLEVARQEPVTVGGHSGVVVDVSIIDGAMAACGSFGGGDVALFPIGTEIWGADPGERFRILAIDAPGGTVAMAFSGEDSPAGSVSQLEQFLEVADRIVQSISF